MFCYKVKQPFPNADTLKIRQYHKTRNEVIIRLHPSMGNRDKPHRPPLIHAYITADTGAKLTIQIMMFPKHLPKTNSTFLH